METTRIEISSVGTLYFCGEDLFFVNLKDIPREKKLSQLTKELIDKRKILEPDRRIIDENILDKAPEIKSAKLALFFFNPRPKDEGGSILLKIESIYEKHFIKGDPYAMIHLNLLDEDYSFVKKFPHMSIYGNDSEMYSLSSHFSNTPSIEGLNIGATSVRRTSGYFPSEFWFCGIIKEII